MVEVWFRVIIVLALQVCSEAVREACTSKVPLMVPPPVTWHPLNTMVTPLRTSVTPVAAQAGGLVLGVTVTWPGQTDSPRASALMAVPMLQRFAVAVSYPAVWAAPE